MSARKHYEREQLFELATKLLEGREEASVRAHVGACAECRAVYESFLKVDSALEAWKPVEPSPWFDARVRAGVAAVEPARRPRTLFGLGWARVVSPALAAMLVVVGFVVIRGRRHTSTNAGQQVAASIQGEPAAGARIQTADQELKMYENLSVLEDYDMLANIEGIPEPAQAGGGDHRVAD